MIKAVSANIINMAQTCARGSIQILTLVPIVLLSSASTQAEPTTKANIIDGLTYADTCLYMLESTRLTEQPDCDKLFEWHSNNFQQLPEAKDITPQKRAKFERNFKLYKSTLRTVKKTMGLEVTGQ